MITSLNDNNYERLIYKSNNHWLIMILDYEFQEGVTAFHQLNNRFEGKNIRYGEMVIDDFGVDHLYNIMVPLDF